MRPSSARGFTLIELMISGALIAVVGVAVAIVMQDQSRLFKDNENLRLVDESSRIATDALSRSIRQAGFGMDPELGVDFSNYNCSEYGSTARAKTTLCATPQRESGAAAADELVLYHRNPDYLVSNIAGSAPAGEGWLTTNFTGPNTLRISGKTETFSKGQILLVACPTATIYTYVTVGTTGATNTALTLEAGSSDPFHQQSAIGNFSCLASGALVFKIEREHYFITSYTANGVGHPYLMLDKGIDVNNDGQIDDGDLIPIASDIVDMQVAYAFTPDPGETGSNPRAAQTAVDATNGNGDWVLWNDPSEGSTLTAPTLISTAAACPDIVVPFYTNICYFERRNLDPTRFQKDPANIASIRVGLVARTETADANLRNAAQNTQVPRLFNRAAVTINSTNLNGSCPGGKCNGFRYFSLQMAESTPNLGSRALFLW